MSFFDDDEPTQATRVQRAARPRAAAPGPSRAADPDAQQMLIRRGVAAGVGLLVLLLLFVGVRGCLDSRKESALKDYNRDVAAIGTESGETASAFFERLVQGDVSPIDQQTELSSLRADAAASLNKAQDLSVPGDMSNGHRFVLMTLQLREEAFDKVAKKIPTARGNERDAAERATGEIAGQMQKLLASDVVWSQRVRPFIADALLQQDIREPVANSVTLTNLTWLDAAQVATRIGGQASDTDTGTGQDNQTAAPGTHGHGVLAVTVGDTTLQPGASNRISATGNPTFTVKFANQGENIEREVRVRVTVAPDTGKAISQTKTVDQTQPGSEAEVAVGLGQAPPIGTPARITVEVLKVAGEQKVDNNKQEFNALFTR